MSYLGRKALSRALVWVACLAGLTHAAFSFYWAFGGNWLLSTVGDFAAEVDETLGAKILMGAIGAAKLIAAIIPVAAAYGRLPWPAFWQAATWAGGLLLGLYGAGKMVASGAVLAGAVRPAWGFSRDAMIGDALLLGPLFLVWGIALLLSLWFARGAQRPMRLRSPRSDRTASGRTGPSGSLRESGQH